ncbi:MCLN1 protein, partial [Cinclus mexicanus]|nr:MCLN1 protein [Cinclus mexicanus]
ILILTLRVALPNVMRFCCCVAVIYLGYCFCGWIVLGPHHPKVTPNFGIWGRGGAGGIPKFGVLGSGHSQILGLGIPRSCFALWDVPKFCFRGFGFFPNSKSWLWDLGDSQILGFGMGGIPKFGNQSEGDLPLSQLHAFIAQCRDSPKSGKFRRDSSASCSASCSALCCCGR